MRKIILFFIIILFLINGCSEIEEQAGECVTEADCVKASCCHASSCVPKEKAPNCEGLACSMECAPGTLDCGQGACKCVGGLCKAEFY